jgi:hypothetical protein
MGGWGAGIAAGVGPGADGGGVNGGGGGGGGVESDGCWFGSGGLGGSFIGKLECGDFDLVRCSGERQAAPREPRVEKKLDDAAIAALYSELKSNPRPRGFPTTPKLMKALPRLLILIAASGLLLAAARIDARTMLDLPGFPVAGLNVYLPAEAYSRLVNAPVKAYIQLRGQIINSKVVGSRVVHSEGGGVYDKASVQIANGMEVYTDVTASRLPPSILVHVVIYQLPKGEHAIALAQDDSLGASNLVYSRSLRMRYLGLANQKQPAPGPKPKKK